MSKDKRKSRWFWPSKIEQPETASKSSGSDGPSGGPAPPAKGTGSELPSQQGEQARPEAASRSVGSGGSGASGNPVSPGIGNELLSQEGQQAPTLWGKAAERLKPEDLKRLHSLIKSKRESRSAVSSPNGQGLTTHTDGHGNEPSDDDINLIVSSAEDLKKNNQKATRRPVLDKIINGVKAFKSLGDAVVQFDKSGYAALGWSVVSFALQGLTNLEEVDQYVLESSEFVTEVLTRYALYEKWCRGPHPDEEFDSRITNVYEAILLHVMNLDDNLQPGKREKLRRALFGLAGDPILKEKKAIDAADIAVRNLLPIIRFKKDSYRDDILAKFWAMIQIPNLPQLSQSLQTCLRSLAFDQMDQRARNIEDPATGTCDWLLTHKVYKEWVIRDRGLLWIKGKPGSGKSTLQRYALDNVIVASNFGASTLVLSFFFHGRGAELQRTLPGLFRSLLYQLLSRVHTVWSELGDHFPSTTDESDKKWQWELPELKRLFKLSVLEVLKNHSVWLLVDALDECGDVQAGNLIRYFKDLLDDLQFQSVVLQRFHICFTCRQYPVLDLDIRSEICLEEENGDAISTFVRDRLAGLSERRSSMIPELIIDGADGVFLWACFIVDRVLALELKGEPLGNIVAEIRSTPPELDKLYRELVRGMESSSRKLIQWICCASRPLSLDELRWAMIVDADCSYKSLKQCRSDVDYIADNGVMVTRLKELSCGLAEVVPSSNRPVVQFIHQSVKDFFLEEGLSALDGSPSIRLSTVLIGLAVAFLCLDYSTRSPQRLLPNYAFPLPIVLGISAFWLYYVSDKTTKPDFVVGTAHYRLSRTCIRYLAMDEIRRSEISRRDEFPLLHYATTSWISHVKESEMKNVPQDDLLHYFEWPPEDLVKHWVRVYNIIGRHPKDCPPKGTTMMHIVSRYQLMGPLRMILQRADQVDIDPKDDHDRTPLSLAAENGQLEAVKFLVKEAGADVESKDKDGQTPLSLAAENSRLEVVKFLVKEAGADVESKDSEWRRTVLSFAAWFGHLDVVKFLAKEAGADVESKDLRWGRTPLSCAAENGHLETVKWLVKEAGADVESKDNWGWTPLSLVAANGHLEVAKFLVKEGGAEVESKDMYEWTPLSRATYEGELEVAKFLVKEAGADVEAKDGYGRTPLSHAAWKGRLEIVKFLVKEAGADVEAKDKDGRTPLSHAAENGHLEIVKFLVEEAEADVESKDDRSGLTPLSLAASSGHLEAVKFLVKEAGADVESKDEWEKTPLSFAAENGHLHVIKFLVKEAGAEVDAKLSEFGLTPLSLAAANGHVEAVKFLVEAGADVESKDREWGRTPLSWAAVNGHLETVKFLVEEVGADVESKDDHGETALGVARKEGSQGRRSWSEGCRAVVAWLEAFMEKKGGGEAGD